MRNSNRVFATVAFLLIGAVLIVLTNVTFSLAQSGGSKKITVSSPISFPVDI